jgi:hypothetical protein
MFSTLDQLIDAIPTDTVETVEVDIAEFLNQSSPVLLTWRRPSVAAVYATANDAQSLIKRFPQWGDVPQLAVSVAMMGACHLAPNPGKLAPGLFYAKLVDKNEQLYFYLLQKINEHFPGLLSEREKKVSSESAPGTSTDTLSN